MKKLYTLLVAAMATFGAGAQSLTIMVNDKAVENGSKIDITSTAKTAGGKIVFDPEMFIKADKGGELTATVTNVKASCTPELDEEWIKGGGVDLQWCGFTELCVNVELNTPQTKSTTLSENVAEDMKLEYVVTLGDEQDPEELAIESECEVKFSFGGKDYEVTLFVNKSTSGVGEIASDNNAPAVYYDLQGRRIDNPSTGIYIVRKGNEVMKRVIR